MASCGFISGLVLLFVGVMAFKLIRRVMWCRSGGYSGGGGGGGCGGGGWRGWHHRHERFGEHDVDGGHPYRGDVYSAEDDEFHRDQWPRNRRGWQRGAAYVAWRLGATAEQRATIEGAARELHDAVREQKPEVKKTRADVAEALRDDDFDADRMGELFARHDVALESMRKAFVGAMAQVHDALDPDQRAKLARIVSRGR